MQAKNVYEDYSVFFFQNLTKKSLFSLLEILSTKIPRKSKNFRKFLYNIQVDNPWILNTRLGGLDKIHAWKFFEFCRNFLIYNRVNTIQRDSR